MGESAAYQIAGVYAQWGDADNAMSWLERAYVIRDPGLQNLTEIEQSEIVTSHANAVTTGP